MKENFTNLAFPETLKVSSSSEMIPLEFFGKVIPLSRKIQFKLGYFSSNSISTLAYGFARFIYEGGTADFLINHFVTNEDYRLLNNQFEVDPFIYSKIENEILVDVQKLGEVLTKKQVSHFFNCLRYLLDNGKLGILPVTTHNGEVSHYKEALFWDSNDNVINIVGSCNFTYRGIVCNGESFIINRSWGESSEKANISNEIQDYGKIFNRESENFIYLKPDQLINIITRNSSSLDIYQLLEEETLLLNSKNDGAEDDEMLRIQNVTANLKINFQDYITEISGPRFPYAEGPRQYQIDAYDNWVENNYKGVFAMATGTGKTITSLNCLLNIGKATGYYRTIILVPSIPLLNQWHEEVRKFHFEDILLAGGGNDWERDLASYVSSYTWGLQKGLILICTYGTFATDRFQKYFKRIGETFLLIADEAHNMASTTMKAILPTINCKMLIGLSATPKRVYDAEGTEVLNTFFCDFPPYTYEFSIDRALAEGFLAEYRYYPRMVELEEDEMEEYLEISKKLLKYFDFEKNEFTPSPLVEMLLLKRKNIIHKARNKIKLFQKILLELEQERKIKYAFAYVPEGIASNGESRLIDQFIESAAKTIPSLKINSYTSEDSLHGELLRGFAEGKIEMLFAMKMLDEGVDVPRAEIGIFCSSTGNPRQFVQRRGRLLRKHPDKAFATIYDMTVIPSTSNKAADNYAMERSLVKKEVQRVAHFASLSMNYYDSKRNLEYVLQKYDLNLDQIISEL